MEDWERCIRALKNDAECIEEWACLIDPYYKGEVIQHRALAAKLDAYLESQSE